MKWIKNTWSWGGGLGFKTVSALENFQHITRLHGGVEKFHSIYVCRWLLWVTMPVVVAITVPFVQPLFSHIACYYLDSYRIYRVTSNLVQILNELELAAPFSTWNYLYILTWRADTCGFLLLLHASGSLSSLSSLKLYSVEWTRNMREWKATCWHSWGTRALRRQRPLLNSGQVDMWAWKPHHKWGLETGILF